MLEITNYFISENNFITDYPNFEANTVLSEYIQALTGCQLLVFPKKNWVEIANEATNWKIPIDKTFKKCLMEAIEKRSLFCKVGYRRIE